MPEVAPASPKVATHVQPVDLGAELALHDHATGSVHVLNPTARLVWESLQDGLSPDDIVRRVCSAFEATSEDVVRADILRILAEFGVARLIDQ